MPVIPFLSLSSGGRSRRRKGQKERLGELRVPEDTKRTSRGPSEGWTAMAALEAGLEDGAAGRQHAVEGTMPSYSDLTARHLPSLPSPASPRQPPKEATPRSSRSWPRPRQIALSGDRPGAGDGAAGVARGRCVRRLVGPVLVVLPTGVLLVTVARGGAFVVGRALRAAP